MVFFIPIILIPITDAGHAPGNISDKLNLPVEIKTDPPLPMLWRAVNFTPVLPKNTQLININWDIEGDNSPGNITASHVFTEPKVYTVEFSGTDRNGRQYKGTKSLNFTLMPGDILFAYDPTDDLTPGEFNRIGIYVGGDAVNVIESGIKNITVSWFLHPVSEGAAWGRVKNISPSEITKVIDFVNEKTAENSPFDYESINPLHLSKQADGPSWYCSELVWAAYLNATRGRIDLDSETITYPPGYAKLVKGDAVFTDEIRKSPHLTILGMWRSSQNQSSK